LVKKGGKGGDGARFGHQVKKKRSFFVIARAWRVSNQGQRDITKKKRKDNFCYAPKYHREGGVSRREKAGWRKERGKEKSRRGEGGNAKKH